MKVFISAVLIFGIVRAIYALDCYTCADTDGFDGEATVSGTNVCYLATPSGSGTCTAGFYCLTKFTIVDGVTAQVDRKCADPANDHDATSTAMPTTNECVTTILPSTDTDSVDTTECYLHCNTDNCNIQTSAGLIACSGDCDGGNGGSTRGRCDYLTGNCVCTTGNSGNNCETATTTTTTTRQCVQCNSETDTNCASSTTMVNCPGTEQYCSATTTVVYGTAGTAVKTVTSRGCAAADGVVDECAFTNIFTDPPLNDATLDYNEITCRSVCNSDGCNSNTANGVVDGNEAIRMYCVVCSDTSDTVGTNSNCGTKTTRQICPSGTTHCKSTVTYFISNVTDIHSTIDPAYSIQSITRECATAAVTAGCTETTMATVTGVKRVTCTETCTTEGCNTGWPARPKCVTCSSSDTAGSVAGYVDGYDECLENPPLAAACDAPHHEYCVTTEFGIQKSNRRESAMGFRRFIQRKCSAFNYGDACTSETVRNVELDNCNYTCTTDGCNQGTSGGVVQVQTMIAVLIPAIFGWLLQTFL